MKTFRTLLCLLLMLLSALPAARAQEFALTEAERMRAIEEILAVAVGELGYTETKGGYSKYGDWAGGAYKEWCSEFVSWCVDQVDLRNDSFLLHNLYPMQVTCNQGVEFYTQRGRYVTLKGEIKGWGEQWYISDGAPVADRPYVPMYGDCVYIEWYKYNRIDHVGLVESVELDETGTWQVHTIEGNNPDSVARFVYPLDDPSIRAYGTSVRVVGTTMREGNAGPIVEELQRALVSMGYLAEDQATGKYRGSTAKAVKALQEAMGLPTTGIADKDTQKVLGLW